MKKNTNNLVVITKIFRSTTNEQSCFKYLPRYEPARVIPVKREQSILEWLEDNNRIIPRLTLLDEEKSVSKGKHPDIIGGEEDISDYIDESHYELDEEEEEEEI